MTRDVVIVGGGIAGLAAAWRLRHRDVLLLEAGDRFGGRMRSDRRGDYWLNYGAHLFPAPGTLVDGMTRDCGLETVPVTGSMMGLAVGSKLINRGPVETYLVGLTAGTTSVITAAAPLATLVLAVLHGQERFSTRGVVGGGLAIAGLAVLSAGNLGGDLRPVYLIAAMLGVVAIGGSSVVVKDFPKAHPVTTNAVGMATGTAFLIVTSVAFREQWVFPRGGRTWLALSWLVVLGSVALFMLFLYVIKRWTASASVYAITMMPVVAVTLGALIADEPITAEVLAGGALVIAAVYVGAISGTGKPREVRPPEPLAAAAEPAPEGRP